LIAPNEAVQLTETMRATACEQYVCLAAESNRSDRRVKESTRYHRSVTHRPCRVPLNKPASYCDFDVDTDIQNP
jgi:hypothetical protein